MNQTILANEHQAWQALTISGTSLLPLLSTDCIMVFPGGMKLSDTSTPTLQSVLTSDEFTPWSSYVISQEDVLGLGVEAAVVVYRVEARRDGERQVFKALCSSTWRKCQDQREGSTEWEMVLHQQTPM